MGIVRILLSHVQVLSITSAIPLNWSRGFVQLFQAADAGTTAGVEVVSPDCMLSRGIDRNDDLENGIRLADSPVLLRVLLSVSIPILMLMWGMVLFNCAPAWMLALVSRQGSASDHGTEASSAEDRPIPEANALRVAREWHGAGEGSSLQNANGGSADAATASTGPPSFIVSNPLSSTGGEA